MNQAKAVVRRQSLHHLVVVFFYFTSLNAQGKAAFSPEDASSSSYKKRPLREFTSKCEPGFKDVSTPSLVLCTLVKEPSFL